MTSNSAEMRRLIKAKPFGKKLYSHQEAQEGITILTDLVVEQGRQRRFATRSGISAIRFPTESR